MIVFLNVFLTFAVMRYFLEFSYNGLQYHGWQKQPNAITVESELTKCMSLQLKESISLVGAGRTDSRVHAMQMFAHFNTIQEIDCDQFVDRLNAFLPDDILIHAVFQVKDNVHARFDAIDRTYQYFISNKKNIFNKNVYCVYRDLDILAMNQACSSILGEHDFTSFSKLHTETNNNLCNVISADWVKEGFTYIFTIKANRFLRNMVRAIVGSMLDIGMEKKGVDSIQRIINEKNRASAGHSVPAQGLFLSSITYPIDIKLIDGKL